MPRPDLTAILKNTSQSSAFFKAVRQVAKVDQVQSGDVGLEDAKRLYNLLEHQHIELKDKISALDLCPVMTEYLSDLPLKDRIRMVLVDEQHSKAFRRAVSFVVKNTMTGLPEASRLSSYLDATAPHVTLHDFDKTKYGQTTDECLDEIIDLYAEKQLHTQKPLAESTPEIIAPTPSRKSTVHKILEHTPSQTDLSRATLEQRHTITRSNTTSKDRTRSSSSPSSLGV